MRIVFVSCTMIFLMAASMIGAGDFWTSQRYVSRYGGDYYRPRNGGFQGYDNHLTRYGNCLNREKGRLQQHEQYLPRYGDYYKWNGRRWQKYENYLPVYGDYLE